MCGLVVNLRVRRSYLSYDILDTCGHLHAPQDGPCGCGYYSNSFVWAIYSLATAGSNGWCEIRLLHTRYQIPIPRVMPLRRLPMALQVPRQALTLNMHGVLGALRRKKHAGATHGSLDAVAPYFCFKDITTIAQPNSSLLTRICSCKKCNVCLRLVLMIARLAFLQRWW